jgi:hypothetical protein
MNEPDFLRVALMLLIPFIMVFFPILLGRWFGIYIKNKRPNIEKAPIGTVVGSSFSLLAFILAFTFSIAHGHFNTRKKLQLDEITNIRSVYMRADLLAEPNRSHLKKILGEYVDVRVALSQSKISLDNALHQSQDILDQLWAYSESLPLPEQSLAVNSFYNTSVINLIDIYNQRVIYIFNYRIPNLAFAIILSISFLTMLSLGFQFGITDKGSIWITTLLAVVFSLVIFLILARIVLNSD